MNIGWITILAIWAVLSIFCGFFMMAALIVGRRADERMGLLEEQQHNERGHD